MSANTIKDNIRNYMIANKLGYTEHDIECIYRIIQGILCYKMFEESFIEEAILLYENK